LKPLLILARIIIVGLIWSVFFMESIRVIMLRNWHFDILNLDHWQIAWDLWSTTWVISEPKEWAFVLIIVSFIPLWFTGWIALSLVSWGKLIWSIISLPWKLFRNFFYKPVKIITTNTGVTPIKRRQSYKEIRPRALRGTPPPIEEKITLQPQPTMSSQSSANVVRTPSFSANFTQTSAPTPRPAPTPAPTPTQFEHALFKFDDDSNDIDFDIDSFDVNPTPPPQKSYNKTPRTFDEDDERPSVGNNEKRSNTPRDYSGSNKQDSRNTAKTREHNSAPQTPRAPSGSCIDIIRQKGYEVISHVAVKNTIIDYVAVSADRICLCMLDREPGDWLADEERFNDEEPLWFSENSHRISPVRKLYLARETVNAVLAAADMNFTVVPFVIVQIGNIINAEDMFDTWAEQEINVTRIDRGTPKEIRLFARALPEADKPIAPGKLDKLINVLNSIK